ncbi:MAG: hypothetical protein CML29_00325 [Rhizobiales bacterium]|nr:hypothetical protein [Hyphomicrobiales bacterium]MBA68566.1 hypothetical protein [Hyphomicrobiales bacterium]|tara:strand:+ start:4563 stop:4796 length:234 start_codon:yes stop_codon:yes gene_type:complete
MKNMIAAMIATLSIATVAAPAVAAEHKAPAATACEQVFKGKTADVDCTATNSIGHQDTTHDGSEYPSAPTNIGGIWF